MPEPIQLPASLEGIFFGFRWDKQALWALPTPVTHASLKDLAWHLDLTVWSSEPPQPLFDLAPRDVLLHPNQHAYHWQRIHAAEISHPLDLFENNGRWVIMDGYHRLARHALLGTDHVPVRLHEAALLALVRRG